MSMPDAELIELGRELAVWWAAERAADLAVERGASEAAAEAITDKGSEVVGKILALPACSLAGFQVKALAASWCYGGDEFDLDGSSTDIRLATSIVRDLIRLGSPEVGAPAV